MHLFRIPVTVVLLVCVTAGCGERSVDEDKSEGVQQLWVHLKLGSKFGSREESSGGKLLANRMQAALKVGDRGRVVGRPEFGGGELLLVLEGPDAREMLRIVRPLVAEAKKTIPLPDGSYAHIYTEPSSNELRSVDLVVPL